MKRFFALILAALLLTGCGNTSEPAETLPESESTPAETAPETEKAPAERDVLIVESPNFKMNRAMFTYFFDLTRSNNASMMAYYGVDAAGDLKAQDCPLEEGTWYDYILGQTVTSVTELVAIAECAADRGIVLDDSDLAKVEETMDELKSEAEEYGCTLNQLLYLTLRFDVTAADVRSCYELLLLADKFASEFRKEFPHVSKEEMEAYYQSHSRDFDSVDVLSFVVDSADFADMDAESAKKAADGYVARLTAAADGEEYRAIAVEYMTEVQGLSEEEKEDYLSDILLTGVRAYNLNGEMEEWAFTSSVGASYIYHYNDTASDVLYLTVEGRRDETLTRKMRHILFDPSYYDSEEIAYATATTAYAELQSNGFDSEAFAKINAVYNDDAGSRDNGGLYENVVKGSYVAEIDTWLFDEGRAVGDATFVETYYGWHIVAYEGETDLASWEAEVRSAMMDEAYTEAVESGRALVSVHTEALQ